MDLVAMSATPRPTPQAPPVGWLPGTALEVVRPVANTPST
jgi:hypothetical protein